MAGFSSVTGQESIMFADNVSFDGTQRGGKVTTNGQLLIGSTAAPHIRVGTLTSSDASITITPGAGTINLQTAGMVATTYTTDSGNATAAGNILNVLGGPGVTTSASGNTVTINSVVFTNTTAATLSSDNGYFATAAGAYVLPSAPAQGEMIIIVCDTAGAVAVTAPLTHLIRIGNQISSAGGTLTSTAIGDSLTLRFRASSTTWFVVSSMGNWTVA